MRSCGKTVYSLLVSLFIKAGTYSHARLCTHFVPISACLPTLFTHPKTHIFPQHKYTFIPVISGLYPLYTGLTMTTTNIFINNNEVQP